MTIYEIIASKYGTFLNKALENDNVAIKEFEGKLAEIYLILEIYWRLDDLKKSVVGTPFHENVLKYETFFNEAVNNGEIKTKEFQEKFIKQIDNDLSNMNDSLFTKVTTVGANMLCFIASSCQRRKTKKEIIRDQLKKLKNQFEK